VPDDEKQPDDDKTKPEDGGDAEAAPAEEEGAAAGGDKFRPEAIAERVDAIGEETDIDRLAREEEAKLTERKKKAKKGKKGGLESAASKRLARIGEGKVKRPSTGRAASGQSMEADPLLDRTVRLGEWLKEHQQVFGAIVAAALLTGGGLLGWTYWQNKRDADASALLATGFADERGAVANKDDDEEEEDGKQASLYPTFKTAAERREAALAAYRKVEAKYAGTGAAILARLSEAGVLLDQGDAKGARGAYEDVKASPLASADAQVRGRALEGIGFADELLAQTEPDAKDKHLDAALSAYKQLEQIDLKGFKELGMYHEARVVQAKGDKAKAVELLKDVAKRVSEPGESHPFAYLQSVAEDRLRDLDPSALPPKPTGGPMGGPMGGGPGGPGGKGGPDMNDPRVREIMRQLEEQMKQKGGGQGLPLPIPGASK
jgi:hypothetical protein